MDRYRHRHVRYRGRVTAFSVQYETLVKGEWRAVVRYDTAHGYVHRDLYSAEGVTTKTPLFGITYSDALTFAESDLKANWKVFKQRFLRGTRR